MDPDKAKAQAQYMNRHEDDRGSATYKTDEVENDSNASGHQHHEDQAAPLSVDALTRYLAIAELSGGWVKNLSALLFLELNRSFVALKKSITLQCALFPIGLTFYISLCGAIGFVMYTELNSAYAGLAAFLVAQLLCIIVTCIAIKRYKSMIGFSNTAEQLREAKHDITSAFK